MTLRATVAALPTSEFAVRLVSALVLAALALLAAWGGTLWVALFWAVAAAATLVEWWALVAPGGAAWRLAGVVYAGALVAAPAVLRADPTWGLVALLWLYVVVWASDIMAYACGRALGGPKLWRRVSPGKTWAGLVGGTLCAAAAGLAVVAFAGVPDLVAAAVLGFAVALVSQGGDLLESAIKRRFGAKDTSRVIPGHGGVMDRIDGFVVAATIAALIGIVRAGWGHAGEGLLLW